MARGETAADRAAKAAKLASPAVDRDALLTLVRLLRLAPPPAKGLLPKVLLNLAAHAPTRDALLRLLFANLRAAMEANEGGAGDCGALYGRDVHVVCSKPDAAARLLAKRALETAVFLARHSAHVSRRIPALAVTSSDAADAAAAGALGAKSPPKFANEIGTDETVLAGNRSVLLPAARPDAGSAGGDGVVALLLRCLGSTAFAPHVGHLELILQLLDATLRSSAFELDRHVSVLRIHREDEEKRKKESETRGTAAEITEAPEEDAATLATDDEKKHDEKKADEKKDDENPRPHGTEDFAVARIREALASDYHRLSAVATLLGRDGLTDSVYAKAADVCRALADVAPASRDALASALSAQVRSRIEDAVANLESVRFTASAGRTAQTMGAKEAEAEAAAAAAAAAAKLPPSVASSGSAILRVSHVVAALLKFDVDAARREETEAAGNALAAAGAGPDDVIPPPRSGADVEAERRRRRKSMGRAIQSFADELNPVWAALGEACTVLEPQIAAAAAVAAASSRGAPRRPRCPRARGRSNPSSRRTLPSPPPSTTRSSASPPPRTPHPSGNREGTRRPRPSGAVAWGPERVW